MAGDPSAESPQGGRRPTTSAEMPSWWRRFGRRGNDGLTRLERAWFARRFRKGAGAKSTPAEMEALRRLHDGD